MKILVTGGAGYIGSHTVLELLDAGHNVFVIDNLINSSQESLRRVEKLTGRTISITLLDLRDKQGLKEYFEGKDFDAVIHFAGLKAVGESAQKPLYYYRNNLESTMNLLEVMLANGTKSLIFSSSATVYGMPEELPITESSPVGIGLTNPYGQTKYMLEQILRDVSTANPDFCVTILRYFNPIGAHPSGQIGEDPRDAPNNLLPFVCQVAVGKRDKVMVHGNDYDTPDGTGVRDYIHVVDLARGHLSALSHNRPGCSVFNLGTGHGTSVLEIIDTFSKICGRNIAYEIGPRRPGDVASCYASADKAAHELGWKSEKTIEDACTDSWRWQSQNPDGYRLE